jgi:uncharacterized membrane protein (TIGR02234 family)
VTGSTPGSRRSFLPAVLLGLAGAGLAALAGTRTWAESTGDAAGIKVSASVSGAEAAPLVAALSLAALAAWGVVLVVRGRFRRVVAVIGLAASLGAFAAVVLAFGDAQDDAVAAAFDQGATGDVTTTALTAWYYVSGLATVAAAVAFAVAVAKAPGWPAMGSKYDAPAVRRDQPDSDEDLWRAIDEGRDPTS